MWLKITCAWGVQRGLICIICDPSPDYIGWSDTQSPPLSIAHDESEQAIPSLHIAELRVSVTKCQLLLLGESLNPVVSSAPSTKLVVVDAVGKAEASQTEAEALKRQVDGVTGVEERGVTR